MSALRLSSSAVLLVLVASIIGVALCQDDDKQRGPSEPKGPLKCYVCDSVESESCADTDQPFHFPNSKQTCPDVDGQKAKYCRKLKQYVRGEVFVRRACGYLDDEKGRECYGTVSQEYNTEVCSCTKSLCNHAGRFNLGWSTASLVLLPFLAGVWVTK